MDIGRIGVWVGLAASVASVWLYLRALGGNRRTLLAARGAFALAAAMTVFSFGRLMALIVAHQFQFKYVYDYSSVDLGAPFIYAATWAGQQGSFLLWAVWTALIGALVIWKAGRWEARIMWIYVSVLVALFGILAVLSPFELIQRGLGNSQYPPDLPWPPPNGNGLNPSLQNYWMAIHPPVIFFGFASLAVPFVYATAAMLWRDYNAWAARVMPYVLMTVATLGVGLFLGGYWAYETQGWHGFWAWDPVENASLFPWLAALALLHGLVVQKSRGGMMRTNLFLAIVPWVLFLYGTFLTRSGVLANFSVHAFGMLENSALVILLWMMGIYGLGGLALLAFRWKRIPGRPLSDSLLSRDTAMFVAVTLMIVAAAVVTFGTSLPLIQKSRIEPIWYNRATSWILILSLLLMGVVPFLAWGKTNADRFMSKLLLPWFAALTCGFGVVAFISAQLSDRFIPNTPAWLVIVIATLGAFALAANLVLTVKLLRVKAITLGGWLAHVGIGMLFMGVVMTNVYEKTEDYLLIQGMGPVKTPFGYALQFAGWTHDAEAKSADQVAATDPQKAQQIRKHIEDVDWWKFDHAVKIKVMPLKGGVKAKADLNDPHGFAHTDADIDTKGGYLALAPVFHNRNQMLNRGEEDPTTMRWPSIHKEWTRDFYIEVANDPKLIRVGATAQPGQTQAVAIPGFMVTRYAVRYKRFRMEGNPGQAGTIMRADMDLLTPEGKAIPISPGLRLGGDSGPEPVAVQIPQVNGAAFLEPKIDVAHKEVTVSLELPGAEPRWVVPVSVTNKPMINLVWLGVIIMGIGALIAMSRRAIEARRGDVMQAPAAAGEAEEPAAPAPAPALATAGASSGGASAISKKARPKAGSKR